MKYFALALLAASASATADCHKPNGEPNGEGVLEEGYEGVKNWFCGKVDQIIYKNFRRQGSYKQPTAWNSDGSCPMQDVAFDGALGPFGEELSIHLRGPINLKEFAAYTIDSSKEKRDNAPSPHVQARRNRHGHLHKRKEEWVTAVINGQVQSWINDYHPEATQPAPPAPPAATAQSQSGNSNKVDLQVNKPVVNAQTTSTDDHDTTPKGSWDRVSYYNAEGRVAKNVVFLGNRGDPTLSGSWSKLWGGSLSYIDSKGLTCAASANVLDDVTIPSDKEFSIWTAEECDDSCGPLFTKKPAYKGFKGNNKIFLFKFKMPFDGDRGNQGDMPALWALNARIPRALQYSKCSCWEGGCGEADIYEVLAKGDNKCKSTVHLAGGTGGGSSDYFERPSDKYIKVAAIFDERSGSFAITRLDDSFDFATSLKDEVVRNWISSFDNSPKGSSTFGMN